MKNKKRSALFLILLFAVFPFASAKEFSVSVPSVSRARSIDISGTAPENSEVDLSINNELRRKIQDVGKGDFTFYNVLLKFDENNLRIQSEDPNGRVETFEKTIYVDDKPPTLELKLPEVVTTSPAQIKGTTDEPITITIAIMQGADTKEPNAVINLVARAVNGNEVTLAWEAPDETDILEYAIYRNGMRVGVSEELTYTDATVASNTSYEYTVRAVDKSCNEGIGKKIRVTTINGASKERTVNKLKLSCETDPQTIEIKQAGEFTLPLNLIPDVPNRITIIAVDRAGHEVRKTQIMTIDTQPPVFDSRSLNLDDLSPSYSPNVNVRGKVSEKAAITVYINDHAETTKLTDDNGYFDISIKLERKIETIRRETTAQFESDVQWVNNIKLVAVDSAGHSTEYGPVPVLYALCGSGGAFKINFGSPIPTKLTPRLMLQGIQTFGFPFNMSYVGEYPVRIKNIGVHPLRLSPKEQDNYDQNWIATPLVFHEVSKDGKNVNGYVQVQFKSFDIKGETTYEKEKNLSEHRQNDCLLPGFGCSKFYLELELQYSEKQPVIQFDETRNQYIERTQYTQPITQKTCDRVEIAIDQVRPEHLIASRHLESVIKFLSTTIDAIDSILEPLTTINTYLVYSCLTGSLGLYALEAVEGWQCKFRSGLDTIKGLAGGESKWDAGIAKAGLCSSYKTGSDAQESCQACEKAVIDRKRFELNILRPICDRVAGPPAPSLQTWLKQKVGEVEHITINNIPVDKEKYKVNEKLFVGSDCAYAEADGQPVFGTKGAGYDRVKEIYANWQSGKNKEKCEPLTRPAHPDCCGYEYMQEWGTACGISQLGLDSFNEIKESVCLAANTLGQNELTINGRTEQCHRLWNSVAGFCEPGGGPVTEPIQTGVRYTEEQRPASLAADEVYLFVYPLKAEELSERSATSAVIEREYESELAKSSTEAVRYKAFIGYVSEKFKFEDLERSGEEIRGTKNYYLNPRLYARETIDVTEILFPGGVLVDKSRNSRVFADAKQKLQDAICREAGRNNACVPDTDGIIEQVRAIVGAVDQTYIVLPDSGLLRSLQCLYTPGIVGWLGRWKNIANHAKTCFQTIQLTGDGSPGVCQEFLSTYVCDFIFDALSCFSQKYNVGVSGTERKYGGIGDVLGAITSAGARTQERMRGRYGESALWKSLFVEKKLQHAVCAFAFTGTWALDVEAIAKLSVEQVPIPSQAVLAPCRKRFVSYTPIKAFGGVTGLTTWLYEMNAFVAPGSDLDLELQLQCSDGFRCDPQDGYSNGECDCNKGGKKIVTIRPDNFQSFLPKDEILDQPIQMLVQATNYDPNPTIRYDSAILKWRSRDPNIPAHLREGETQCSFNLVGGDAPNFCSFDPISLSYRCQFGAQESGIKIFEYPESKPEYTYELKYTDERKKNISLFTLGDYLKFNVKIKQDFPSEAKNQLQQRKFLTYKVVTQEGEELAEPFRIQPDIGLITSNLQLVTDGTYKRTIEIREKVKNEYFGTGRERKLYPGFDIDADKELPQNFEEFIEFDLIDEQGNSMDYRGNFVLEFSRDDAGQLLVDVYESTGSSVAIRERTREERGFQKKAIPIQLGIPVDFGREIQIAKLFTSGLRGGEIEYMIKLIVSREIPLPERRTAQVFVRHPKSDVRLQNPCSRSAVPQTWQAVFTIYDSDEFGNPTDRISIDPQTGDEAEVAIPFRIICAKEGANLESGNVELIEGEDATQSGAGEDAIQSDAGEGAHELTV